MEKLQATYQATIRWRSYELRPAGSPPISPEYRARIESYRPQMRQMAQEQYGLALNEGPFGIDSRPALIGAKYAEAQGMGAAYHQAVFRAYWQEGQDIGDTAVLENIAVRVGLDRAAFGAALADTAYTHQVIADIEQARQYGLSGVPALVFANKYLVVGAQPYTLLEEVVQKVLAEA